MTFWAKHGDRIVVSQDYLEPDWKIAKDKEREARLRGETLYTCPDCGERLHLVSIDNAGYRTQFFRHDADTACIRHTKPESIEHIRLKKAVFDICVGLGWKADVEVTGPGWKADVLAWNGNRRYAFEVQVSDQAGERVADRSAKYRASGVTPVWFHATFPKSCPFEIDRRTFHLWWRTHREVPEWEMHGARWATIPRERGLEIVEKHLWHEIPRTWRMQTVLTYWKEGGAIIGTIESNHPTNPRVRLWGYTTMVDAVARVFTGEIEREFAGAITKKYEELAALAKDAGACRRAKDAGVVEDYEHLRDADLEKYRQAVAEMERHRAEEEARQREIEERRERARLERERIEAEARRKADEEAAARAMYVAAFGWVTDDLFDMDAALARERGRNRAREEMLAADAKLTAWDRKLRERDREREKQRLERRARSMSPCYSPQPRKTDTF